MRTVMDPYESLANAVVLQAVKDYRRELRCAGRTPLREELERFFSSVWYSQLTKLDGEYLMRKLQEESR